MNPTRTVQEIRDEIEGYERGIEHLWGDVSLTNSGKEEAILREAIDELQSKIGPLTSELQVAEATERSLYTAGAKTEQSLGTSLIVTDVHAHLIRELSRDPKGLFALSPRRFEILVHDILKDFGFDCTLTQATRDGGCDIYAHLKAPVLDEGFLLFVECKRWTPPHHVGIDVVQRVNGARDSSNAHRAMIVTTSFFTRPALDEQKKVAHKLDLTDYDRLCLWLRRLTAK